MFLWTFLACVVVSAEPVHDEIAAGKKFQHLFLSYLFQFVTVCSQIYTRRTSTSLRSCSKVGTYDMNILYMEAKLAQPTPKPLM